MHQNPKKRGVSFLSDTVVEIQLCFVSHSTGEGNIIDIIEYEVKYADNSCVLLV